MVCLSSREHYTAVPSTLLPLINDNINSPAMAKHCVMVIQKVIKDINPGQSAVITTDQPVYLFPNAFGEDEFVMMGGLHIEMAMLSFLGDWLKEIRMDGFSYKSQAKNWILCSCSVRQPFEKSSIHSSSKRCSSILIVERSF